MSWPCAAHIAARAFASATQEDVDRITAAMARAGTEAAERLGRLAAEETGYGRAAHKTFKNVFNTQWVYEGFKDERTVGVIENDTQKRVITIAEPVGVIAGLVPVTNPTSTVLFKSLISAKTRNAIVLAPHPRAVRSSGETARVMQEAAQEAGAPADLIQSMSRVSVAGTDALMRHHRTDLVLATGSRAMVLAAYSSGKPTYAVGPGNVPAYIHASVRDIDYAARCIMAAKIFDWGTACASEQSAIVDRSIAAALQAAMERQGALFLSDDQQNRITQLLFPQGGRGPSNVEAVSQSPATLAHLAGFTIPEGTQLLVVRPGGIGYDFPLSREILGPVFKFIEVDGPDEGIATAVAQLRFGGDGHTAAVHAQRRGRHLALRGGRAGLPRARQHAVAVRRHGLLDGRRPHVHDRHRHDRRLDLLRQHRRAAPAQPQARGGADPRLGDARERPGRPRASPPGRSTASPSPGRARGALRGRAAAAPAPAPLRPPPPHPRRPRRPRARASRSSCARRSQR